MPLSEHEQRMLDEIESALYAEDPKFATTVRRSATGGPKRPAVLVVLLGLIGLMLLVGGLALGIKPGGFPIVSLLGFFLMFGAGVWALRSSSGGSVGAAESGPGKFSSAKGRRSSGGVGQSYGARMEDRFRRRFDS